MALCTMLPFYCFLSAVWISLVILSKLSLGWHLLDTLRKKPKHNIPHFILLSFTSYYMFPVSMEETYSIASSVFTWLI